MPSPLSFKARYIEPILQGRKRYTMRARTRLKVGDEVAATCRYDRPPFARLRITAIREVRLGDLTEADARADGYTDLAARRDEWNRLHPGHPWRSDRTIHRICFIVLR